jgi:hypothetical protein
MEDENTRILEFVKVKLNCSKEQKELIEKALIEKNTIYRRLSRIILTGDTAMIAIPDDVQTWNSFCDKNPDWKDLERSYVCFRDDPVYEQKNILKQRVQNSALCYLHAPCILLYYLYKRNHPEFNEIIDISSFIRNNFNKELLSKHIFDDFGGNSLQILKDLTLHIPRIKACNIEDIDKDFLIQYGPVLTNSFLIYDDMIDMNISSHSKTTFKSTFSYDLPSCPQILKQISLNDLTKYELVSQNKRIPDKCHALLLIGIRNDDDKTYYLFQNWWKEKQFFEADIDYLIECEIELHYVAEKIMTFQKTDLICGEYFETNCDIYEMSPNHEIYNFRRKNKTKSKLF